MPFGVLSLAALAVWHPVAVRSRTPGSRLKGPGCQWPLTCMGMGPPMELGWGPGHWHRYPVGPAAASFGLWAQAWRAGSHCLPSVLWFQVQWET
jgi:hypothetical protein